MTDRPTRGELEAYARGSASTRSARRVRRYLMQSGDDVALEFVSQLAAAQRRVVTARATSTFASIEGLGRWLGHHLDLLEGQLVLSTAGIRLGSTPTGRTVHLRVPVPRHLYILGLDWEGRLQVLWPGDVDGAGLTEESDAVDVPEEILVVLGIAAARRVPLGSSTVEAADVRRSLGELLRRGDVQVGLLAAEDEGE